MAALIPPLASAFLKARYEIPSGGGSPFVLKTEQAFARASADQRNGRSDTVRFHELRNKGSECLSAPSPLDCLPGIQSPYCEGCVDIPGGSQDYPTVSEPGL